MIAAYEDASLSGRVDVGLVVGVFDGGAFGGTNIDEFDFFAFGNLLPVDGALVFGHIDALCLQCCEAAHCKHKKCASK